MIYWYNAFITVPPNGSSSAEMACPITQDINLVSGVSHMHKRGVNYTSAVLDNDPLAGGQKIQTLHETTDWDEPQTSVFPGGLKVKQGQWIDYRCDYQNPESRNVAQGSQTTDEMCQFLGAYWPRLPEIDYCGPTLTPPSIGGRSLGTGAKNGADYEACMAGKTIASFYGGGPSSSEARYAAQKCVTDLCPKVSGHVWDTLTGGSIANLTCN